MNHPSVSELTVIWRGFTRDVTPPSRWRASHASFVEWLSSGVKNAPLTTAAPYMAVSYVTITICKWVSVVIASLKHRPELIYVRDMLPHHQFIRIVLHAVSGYDTRPHAGCREFYILKQNPGIARINLNPPRPSRLPVTTPVGAES